jgi:protease I
MFDFLKRRQLGKKHPRIAVLVGPGVDQQQLDAAVKALQRAGADTFVVAPGGDFIRALRGMKKGVRVPVDATLNEVHPGSFGALLLPGGAIGVDSLRGDTRALEFVRTLDRMARPIAAIGHAGLLLASAGIVRGRRVTSWPGVRDDMINAGAIWLDEPVVIDDNLVTARSGADAKKWVKQLVRTFADQTQSMAVAE